MIASIRINKNFKQIGGNSYIRKNSHFVVSANYNSKQKINQGIDERKYKDQECDENNQAVMHQEQLEGGKLGGQKSEQQPVAVKRRYGN